MFLFFYWLVDVRGYRKLAFPFLVIGMNAVAIYMSESIIPWSNIVAIFTHSLGGTLGSFTPLFHAIAVLTIEWLVLYWMYKRKIFLTASRMQLHMGRLLAVALLALCAIQPQAPPKP